MSAVYLITGNIPDFAGTSELSGKKESHTQRGKSDRVFCCLLVDGRLTEIHISQGKKTLLGNIYVGKVKNVLKNIDAAFVEIAGGQTCFLPLSTCSAPILTNRLSDGRLLAGDEILVQVSRDAVKTKDPVLTAQIFLPGRYASVSIGTSGKIRYSHKLTEAERDRLKEALQSIDVPPKVTVVVRTQAGALWDLSLLTEEAGILLERAKRLLSVGKTRTVYSLISEELPGYLRHLREARSPVPDKIVTDDSDIYTETQSFLAQAGPDMACSLELYRDDSVSLSQLYGLSAKAEEAVAKNVWLKSGGYLVIEPTEALTVIDVNTGKYAGKKNTEDTFRLINEEAADEVARQLRLRNISGIVLVDFINMESRQERQKLMARLRERCEKDPVTCRVVDMTSLGLVEITRKKVEKPLLEQLKER